MKYVLKGKLILVNLEAPKCSDTLTPDQLKEIINLIWSKHRFGGLSKSRFEHCRHIKYIRPDLDMRDGRCFHIRFDDVSFDYRGSERSMYERIIGWLNGDAAECGGLLQ